MSSTQSSIVAAASPTHGLTHDPTHGQTPPLALPPESHPRILRALIFVALLFFALVVIQNAWIDDDGYITFRTVDNFLHGHGLRWNVDERVQSYTHPLWMWLLSLVAALPCNLFYGCVSVSIALSLATAIVYCFGIARTPAAAVVGLLALAFSKGFVDYSTSGLENPLTHLLLALFLWVYLRAGDLNARRFFALSLLAGLATLNRMDVLLLFLPPLAYALLRVKTSKRRALALLCLGFAPFAMWEAFSLLYYGFLFPNTAYAKLNTGIPSSALMRQALIYFADTAKRDPLAMLVIVAGIASALWQRSWRAASAAVGVVLYLVYILRIGGDFMACRLFAAPFLTAVVLIADACATANRRIWIGGALAVVVIGLAAPRPPICTTPRYGQLEANWNLPTGIDDERGFYFDTGALINCRKFKELPALWTADLGRAARSSGQRVTLFGMAGCYGYCAGPEVHVIDFMALCDPLLARLPALQRAGGWRIGHFGRQIPAGYVESLESGTNQLQDERLAQYYDQLRLITRGHLFDRARLIAIWKMNTGQDDEPLRSYVQDPMARVTLVEVPHVFNPALKKPVLFGHSGLRIDLGEARDSNTLVLRLPSNNLFYVMLFAQERFLGTLFLDPAAGESRQGWTRYVLEVPPPAIAQRYDNIRIVPSTGIANIALGEMVLWNDPNPKR